MEKLVKPVEDKLCLLLSFLRQLPGKLEMIADEIDNENLRDALCAAASETNEYAKELNAHLKRLSITPPLPAINHLEEEIIEKGLLQLPHQKGGEVLYICETCDAFFCRLYNDLLMDDCSNPSLKNMMDYQLLGIKSAFMRIRFLNSLRFLN